MQRSPRAVCDREVPASAPMVLIEWTGALKKVIIMAWDKNLFAFKSTIFNAVKVSLKLFLKACLPESLHK